MAAPKKVPMTEPKPPVSKQPPTTAQMMKMNSRPIPSPACIERSSSASMIPISAAVAVDPVAEARLREQPGADDGDRDPPKHLDLEVVVGQVAREELAGRLETARAVDVLDRGLASQLERDGGVHALQHEERRQRHDKARQLRPDHRDPVDETDYDSEEQDERDRRPDVDVPKCRQIAEQQP